MPEHEAVSVALNPCVSDWDQRRIKVVAKGKVPRQDVLKAEEPHVGVGEGHGCLELRGADLGLLGLNLLHFLLVETFYFLQVIFIILIDFWDQPQAPWQHIVQARDE